MPLLDQIVELAVMAVAAQRQLASWQRPTYTQASLLLFLCNSFLTVNILSKLCSHPQCHRQHCIKRFVSVPGFVLASRLKRAQVSLD